PGPAVDRVAHWVAQHGPSAHLCPLLRLAIHRSGQPFLYYLKLINLWKRFGAPMLKPNATRRKLLLLTDTTGDNLPPLLQLFCAGYGVELEVEIPPFDSVEQVALAASDQTAGSQIVVLSLSEHWLARYLGTAPVLPRVALSRAEGMLDRVIAGLRGRAAEHLLV